MLDPRYGARHAGARRHADLRDHGAQVLGRLPQADGLLMSVEALYADHIAYIDEGDFDSWLGLFTEDCHYEIKPRENEQADLPIPLLLCRNRRMLQDRVVALQRANIYQPHVYRHFISGIRSKAAQEGIQ